MCMVQQRKMENTQNTIPEKQQAEAIQLVASGKPVATTTKEKNPKRVASGKRLAEHNRRKREEQQEGNSFSSQLSSIPNIVSIGTLLLGAYTVYSNRKPAQQQYTNSKTAKPQQDESNRYM